MAHTKAKGTTKLGRDSESQRLGVKIFGGSPVKCGQIIIRQRGTRYMTGNGVKIGRDDTIYAVRDGLVSFKKTRYTNFTGNKKLKQIVSVLQSQKSNIKNPACAEASAGRQNDNLKIKNGEREKEIQATEQFNPKEFQEKQAKEPRREEIREEELPKIPPRQDIKKSKNPVKHSHKK